MFLHHAINVNKYEMHFVCLFNVKWAMNRVQYLPTCCTFYLNIPVVMVDTDSSVLSIRYAYSFCMFEIDWSCLIIKLAFRLFFHCMHELSNNRYGRFNLYNH